jgi:hypothetical protein
VPERKPERKPWRQIILCAHAPPHRRCFRIRIAGGEQQLRLMRLQRFRRFSACRPPLETAFRQALCGDPEALPVIREDPDRLATAAAKDKQAARKRIGRKFLPAQLRQRIYALPLLRCTAKEELCAVHEYAEFSRKGLQDLSSASSKAMVPDSGLRIT